MPSRTAVLSTLLVSCAFVSMSAHAAVPTRPLVAQMPALGHDRIAFTHGGEIWVVGRRGGEARRMTAGAGVPTTGRSAFSPDGRWLAYTATYGGDADVYVIPVAGGDAKRLTFDPKPDEAVGWSNDGNRVLFRSTRNTFYDGYGLPKVYSVALDGGRPEALPFPLAYNVAWATDGRRAAVEPQQLINRSWKQYRGGDQRQIRVVDGTTLAESRLPGPSANDFDPMWVGETLYFVSDRQGRQALYAWGPSDKEPRRLFDPGDHDILSASLGPNGIVFARIDGIGLYDLTTSQVEILDIEPVGERPGMQVRTMALVDQIVDAAIDGDGTAAFEARGRTVVAFPSGKVEIFGDSTHVERSPAFRTNGRLSAFSDASGSYELATRDLTTENIEPATSLAGAGFQNGIAWAPDGRHALYVDANFDFFISKEGTPAVRIDREAHAVPWLGLDASWSRDGSQVAYSRTLQNGLSAIFVWSKSGSAPRQVSPDGVDARSPSWDADGKRMWFTASVSTPPVGAYLDLSDKVRPPSTRVVMSIQMDSHIETIPLRLDLPAKRYERVVATTLPGALLLLESEVPAEGARIGMPLLQALAIVHADAETPAPVSVATGIDAFYPSELFGRATTTFRAARDGSHVLFRKDGAWQRADVTDGQLSGIVPVSLEGAIATINPAAEWRQMFDDAFRMLDVYAADARREKPDFYAWKTRYASLAASALGSRDDLTYLLDDIAGELHQSHAGAEPPMPVPFAPALGTGVLGIDVEPQAGRYKITRIYHADILKLDAPAPMDVPALAARPGDFIETINGAQVSAQRDLAEYLIGRASKPTRVCLTPASGGSRRCADVTPIANDAPLRFAAWRNANAERVASLSGGRLGYIHMSDTIESGLEQFNQGRFAQHDRDGFIIDVRFNSGGYAADYVIQQLTADRYSTMLMPHGRRANTPGARLGGPKALLINAYCGSGCDTLSWYFADKQVGPLVGTPTWGGVSGSGNMPMLMDGGRFNVPSYTMTDPQGRFVVEGDAVQPTIPVELSQAAMAAGRDPQLERAIENVMSRIDPP